MRNLCWLGIVVSFGIGAETICTGVLPKALDPQQGSDYLQSYLASRLYRPLFGSQGIVSAKSRTTPESWKLTLSAVKFAEVPGFKERFLDATDVKHSLERQLSPYAANLFEAQSLNPAKLNGFSRTYKSLKVISPKEVEVTFNRPVEEAELEALLAPPVGYIVPKNFKLPLSETFVVFPPTKDLKLSYSPRTMTAKQGKDAFSLVAVPTNEQNAAGMKKYQCKRMYYPPPEMIKAAEEKKIQATVVKASQTKFFFRLNQAYTLPKDGFARVRSALDPSKLKFSEGQKRSTSLFSEKVKTIAPLKSPTRNADQQAYLAYCDSAHLRGVTSKNFIMDMNDAFKKALGTKVMLYPYHCDQLIGLNILPGNVVGAIVGMTYSHPGELLRSLDCERSSLKPFNTCLPTSGLTKESADAEISKSSTILPIADFSNNFLEFF